MVVLPTESVVLISTSCLKMLRASCLVSWSRLESSFEPAFGAVCPGRLQGAIRTRLRPTRPMKRFMQNSGGRDGRKQPRVTDEQTEGHNRARGNLRA